MPASLCFPMPGCLSWANIWSTRRNTCPCWCSTTIFNNYSSFFAIIQKHQSSRQFGHLHLISLGHYFAGIHGGNTWANVQAHFLQWLLQSRHCRVSIYIIFPFPIIQSFFLYFSTMREFAMVQLCYWDYAPCIKQSLEEFAKIRRSCNGQRQLSDRECNTFVPGI